MIKGTQTIRRLLPTNCLSMFDHFVGLLLKGLINKKNSRLLISIHSLYRTLPKQFREALRASLCEIKEGHPCRTWLFYHLSGLK